MEAAIVLGVVGLVIGGIWVAASAVTDRQKINEFQTLIMNTCDRATKLLPRNMVPASAQQTLYALYAAGVFPPSYSWSTSCPGGWGTCLKSPIGDIVQSYQTTNGVIRFDIWPKFSRGVCNQVSANLSKYNCGYSCIGSGGNLAGNVFASPNLETCSSDNGWNPWPELGTQTGGIAIYCLIQQVN